MSDSTAPEYRPRDDLIRMVELPAADVEFRADNEGPTLGTLEGYAAVFNEWTPINSWEGRFEEMIAPGAFKKTLRDFGDRVKVLFNHGFDPSIGDKPLGKPRSIEEDKRGLRVEVPLDDTSYNRDLVASLRSGALDGMSFRFSVSREEWDETGDTPKRTIREVARLFELGPVTFPAYEATTAGVRAREAYQAWRTAHPTQISDEQSDDPDDAALEGTSEESSDTPPVEAPVGAHEETEPAMPVRRLNTERIRAKAAEYVARAEKI
jgi:HK97 family phage prohead protease